MLVRFLCVRPSVTVTSAPLESERLVRQVPTVHSGFNVPKLGNCFLALNMHINDVLIGGTSYSLQSSSEEYSQYLKNIL